MTDYEKGRLAGRAEALKIVEGWRLTTQCPLGSLFGGGWNEAVDRITAAIRALQPPSAPKVDAIRQCIAGEVWGDDQETRGEALTQLTNLLIEYQRLLDRTQELEKP